MNKSIVGFIAALLVCMAGCSTTDRSNFCTGTTVGAMGGFNPFAIPCIANTAVDVGTDVVSKLSADTVPPPKSFRPSNILMKELSDSPDLLMFVLESQDKYKAANYGTANEAQKNEAIGRYVSEPLKKSIIIYDDKDTFRVLYESEFVNK